MSHKKSSLHEIAHGASSIKTARSQPIKQEAVLRKNMDFIRSLTYPVKESLDIESLLHSKMESEIKKLETPLDQEDYVSFDIPLLIRTLELAREGIKSDVELHELVERIISIRKKGVLTMDDYEVISGGNIEGTDKEFSSSAYIGDQQDESIDLLKKLAGLR